MSYRNEVIELDITQDIIDTSVRQSSSHCLFAEGLKAAVPGAKYVSVDLQSIRWSVGEKRYIVFTPRRGQLALLDFDQGIKPDPFKMRLSLRGAQIRAAKPRNDSPEAREKRHQDALKRARSRKRFVSYGDGAVPGVADGQAPPLGPLAHPKARVGMRRGFGLRQLGQ